MAPVGITVLLLTLNRLVVRLPTMDNAGVTFPKISKRRPRARKMDIQFTVAVKTPTICLTALASARKMLLWTTAGSFRTTVF